MTWTRRSIAIALVGGVVVLAIAGGGLYLELGQGPDRAALSAVQDDPNVIVTHTVGGHLVHSGTVSNDTTGIVLYPGGLVTPESYVPTAAEIAVRDDVAVVIPKMPYNLAILDVDRAGTARDAAPEIRDWYVAGHSLGGVAACRYAVGEPDEVEGIVLFASYCDRDGSDADLRALSVLATEDEVLDREAERRNRELFPAEARIVEIDGMNHAQFGAYGSQRGDGTAKIDNEAARNQVAIEVVVWLEQQ
ncbi:Alpha/beta hydrolase family enzyme [Halalkaliarchaeum sp. AArc-CO]|uniref:alpha/beta hydrolase n=1 Tax=Halalkaliarchaeum sp. AArc-CO TaxID=2866381 RepID=UPI00217F07B1|nr:alpha/beta hydrolase [Halalkaliarchaeum sp. AArc-CO]UWG50580.1 Alpha/beta hydrolase family enzyme [Halalkaliarchaeum sp. AArc-CO]